MWEELHALAAAAALTQHAWLLSRQGWGWGRGGGRGGWGWGRLPSATGAA